MSKPSFTKDNKEKTMEGPPTSKPTATPPPREEPSQESGGSGSDSSDIIMPTLKIVQSVGPMSESFTPGAIVFAGELVLSLNEDDLKKAGQPIVPVVLTVVKIKKQFEENVEYGSEVWPRIFDTEEQVKAAGGWTEWNEGEKPPFSAIAKALVMVKRPDGCDSPLMAFEHNGASWGAAVWKLKGSAYTSAAKLIFTAEKFALKDGLHRGSWLLTTRREKRGKNFVQVPVLRHGPRNDAAGQQFMLEATAS